jgi:hypothetical protein
MNSRIRLPIVLLVLSSLACSVFGTADKAIEVGKDAATRASEAATAVGEGVVSTALAETSEEATPELESTDDAAEAASSPDVDADALSALDSYRVRMVSQWIPEERPAEMMTVEEAHTRNPAAQRFVIDMGDDIGTELVQIGNQAWYCSGGSCTQAQADPEELAANFVDSIALDPADIMRDARARFIGREEMNGVQTRHYTLDLTDVQAAFVAQGEANNVQGEVWIADEPNLPSYTARFHMTWEETRDEEPGTSEFAYDVYDVNAPFTIEPPEGAESSGLPEDVPTYPNSDDLFTTEGMATFSSPDAVTSVADFYRNALPAQGWTNESDEEMGDVVNQVWQKDDRKLTLMVTAADEGSAVIVTVE